MAVLNNISTRAPKELDKEKIRQDFLQLKEQLDKLQNLLYAGSNHAVLVIIQGMDASGKDGAIKKVFEGLNPQGVSVKSFKAPTPEEAKHDFLWRIHPHAPSKGMIQIFNRSQYEDVLITRVHGWCNDETAAKRFDAINHFERLLHEQNKTCVLKFYLHVSAEEQQQRLQERMTNPQKAWKSNPRDLEEAKLWDKYMQMYEAVFENCNDLPWTIVPSDQNWYKEYLIAKTLTEALAGLNMQYPLPEKKGI